MNDVTILQAVLAGFLSFISPCILPLLPVYTSLIASLSIAENRKEFSGMPVLFSSIAFISGFLLIFIMTGGLFLGSYLAQYHVYLRITGGVLTILTGLYTSGFVGVALFLKKTNKFPVMRLVNFPLALMIGIGFATGWTPCIGPTLGLILVKASTQGTANHGLLMLISYSLGLAAPFLVITLIVNACMKSLHGKTALLGVVTVISGIFLVVMGVILLMDDLRQLTPLFPDLVSY